MEPGGQPPLDYTATVMAAIFFGCAGVLQVCWRPSQLARLLRPVARRPSPVAAAPVPYALLSRALAHAGLRQVRHPDGLRLMRFAPRLSAGARAGERERRAVASGSAAPWRAGRAPRDGDELLRGSGLPRGAGADGAAAGLLSPERS